jgi:hypothetical protein
VLFQVCSYFRNGNSNQNLKKKIKKEIIALPKAIYLQKIIHDNEWYIQTISMIDYRYVIITEP